MLLVTKKKKTKKTLDVLYVDCVQTNFGRMKSSVSTSQHFPHRSGRIKKNANGEPAVQDQLPVEILWVSGQAQLDVSQAS